jgi:hypothetical protein
LKKPLFYQKHFLHPVPEPQKYSHCFLNIKGILFHI